MIRFNGYEITLEHDFNYLLSRVYNATYGDNSEPILPLEGMDKSEDMLELKEKLRELSDWLSSKANPYDYEISKLENQNSLGNSIS